MTPELLAPAGSPAALEAACAAGADAVYLGASRFGARAAAGFSAVELESAVEYAHARDVRVYVTVNTLVTERELGAAAGELERVYESGADAVLVQDAGVASVAQEVVPELPLHASTQMTVHSADGVRAAADLGCKRVVLARELSLPEVEAIARAVPGVELEVFAHGALCYGWSGQCLFSSAIGGRSGNRGRCAQPCRKPYRLLRGGIDAWGRLVDTAEVPLADRYLLSPRDLRLHANLGRLAASPIAALKIEGRLRSPAYVGTVVGCYRAALDRTAQGTMEAAPDEDEALRLAFNRGFTRGRILGDSGEAFMGRDRPGPRGIRAGTVIGTATAGRALVRLEQGIRLRAGDGLVAASQGRPDLDAGAVLRQDAREQTVPVLFGQVVPAGTPVFLTSRATPWRPPQTRVVLDLEVRVDQECLPIAEGIVQRRRDGPLAFRATGDPMAPARTRPLSPETIEEHLRRTGGTPYELGRVTVDLSRDLFAPASALNEFRRRILDAAAVALIRAGRPNAASVALARERLEALAVADASSSIAPRPPRLRCLVDTPAAAGAAAGAGADEVAIEPRISIGSFCGCQPSGPTAVGAALAEALDHCGSVPLLWAWPRVTRQRFFDRALPLLEDFHVAGILVDSIGAARAIDRSAPTLAVHGGPGLNLWNSRAVRAYARRFSSLTLSPELSRSEIADVVGASRASGTVPPLGVLVQGNLELLVSDDCIPALDACPSGDTARYALEDDRRRRFPVLPDGECRSRLLNAVETCLIDHLPALASAGIELLVIDARGRTPAWAAAVVAAYRAALSALGAAPGDRRRRLASLKEDLRAIAAGGITVGPFVRGRDEREQLLPGSEHGSPCDRSSS